MGRGRLLNLRWLPTIGRTTRRDVREVSDGPRSQRGCARTDRRRQPGRPVGRAVPALARSRRAGGGAARGHRDQRPGRSLPPPHGGDPALGRARGHRPAQVGGAVPAGRRDQQRRVAGGPGDRELLPEPQRRGRRVQPDGAAVHQPGRARTDPARPGRASSARGCGTAPSARRWSRTRTASRRSSATCRSGTESFGAGEVRHRGRRKPQPGPRTARHPHATATACCRTASPSTSGRWPISGRCWRTGTRASTT